MAAPKWLCVSLMAVLLSLSICSANRVKSLRFSSPMSDSTEESKLRHILAELGDHEHGNGRDIAADGGGGGGGGGWSSGGSHGSGYGFGHGSGDSNMPGSGGGGGGGWSSGGGGGGGSGYGYGHGGGSSGGGGGGWSSGSGGEGYGYGSGHGFDDGFYPPGYVPGIGGPFHCQPITCGNPNGCPGFVFHFTSNRPATVKDAANDALGNDQSKNNSDAKSPESG